MIFELMRDDISCFDFSTPRHGRTSNDAEALGGGDESLRLGEVVNVQSIPPRREQAIHELTICSEQTDLNLLSVLTVQQ